VTASKPSHDDGHQLLLVPRSFAPRASRPIERPRLVGVAPRRAFPNTLERRSCRTRDLPMDLTLAGARLNCCAIHKLHRPSPREDSPLENYYLLFQKEERNTLVCLKRGQGVRVADCPENGPVRWPRCASRAAAMAEGSVNAVPNALDTPATAYLLLPNIFHGDRGLKPRTTWGWALVPTRTKMAANSDERRKRWKQRKRRKYTAAKRMEILNAVEEAGVVEAERRHGVPQTTVSNWLHRDATKVMQEQAGQQAADGAGGARVTRKAREATMMVSEETAGAKATTIPTVAASASNVVAAKVAAPKVAAVTTEPLATKATKPTTVLPTPGTVLPNSLIKRVARSYTPSEKAVALEEAAKHGVKAASDKLGMSRFSIYAWDRKVVKAAAGKGPSPTSGPAPQEIEEQRDREILGEWRKHPGLGPSQIRNQLRLPVDEMAAMTRVRGRRPDSVSPPSYDPALRWCGVHDPRAGVQRAVRRRTTDRDPHERRVSRSLRRGERRGLLPLRHVAEGRR